MSVLFLCKEEGLNGERRGYARALRRRGGFQCVPSDFPLDGHIEELIGRLSDRPSLIVHPEARARELPRGIGSVGIPTACFQIDTYRLTNARIRFAMLFDYAILFHPGFSCRFKQSGHPNPILLAHAVDSEVFMNASRDRTHDVGFIGRIDNPVYDARQRLLPRLAGRFRMNDWRRQYAYDEMAEVLRDSKVGVNIPRDDYPQDANLRCFEVMASGALLITPVPSELSHLGFQDGEHFVGFRTESELVDLISHYLSHAGERGRIAQAGRELTMREHTYDQRVELLLSLPKGEGALRAPARRWPEERQQLVYLRYYLTHERFDYAWRELGKIRHRSPRSAVVGLYRIAEALAGYARAHRALPEVKLDGS